MEADGRLSSLSPPIGHHNLHHLTLGTIIQDSISAIGRVDFLVKVVIMDQEASQWKWLKSMNVSIEWPFFICDDENTIIVPDLPHLIKNVCNNFMNKNIFFTLIGQDMVGKWSDLQMTFKLDQTNAIRAVPKRTDNHFTLPCGKWMKISLAC